MTKTKKLKKNIRNKTFKKSLRNLKISSNFECGNITLKKQTHKDNKYEVNLEINKEPYPLKTKRKYHNWFYFKVSNVRKDIRYKFTVINLVKPDSSYNQG